MDNSYRQRYQLVENIVSYIIYQTSKETEVNIRLVVERVIELIKDKKPNEQLIAKVTTDILKNHANEVSRKGYDIRTLNYLYDTLRKFNFSGHTKTLVEIEYIVKHSLLEFPITNDEMEKTIVAIAQYSFDRQENDYEHYKNYLLKSKVLKKCNPPLQVFDKLAQRFVDEFVEPKTEIDYSEIPDDIYIKMCSGCEKEKMCHEECVTCEKLEQELEKEHVRR